MRTVPLVWNADVDAVAAFVGYHSIQTVEMIHSDTVALDSFAFGSHDTWLGSPILFEPATKATTQVKLVG